MGGVHLQRVSLIADDDSGVATSVDEFFLDSIDLPFEEIETLHPSPRVEPIEFVSDEVRHSEVGRETISKKPSYAIQERENIAKDIKFILDALKVRDRLSFELTSDIGLLTCFFFRSTE